MNKTLEKYKDYLIRAKYIHGSQDSTDVDVHYVFDKMPSFAECKEFCDTDKSENRNIITIDDGIVTGCYKGTVDEVNNGLLATYALHEQEYTLLVTKKVERNKPLKFIRAIRIILSHLSRSQYRPEVKETLRSTDWNTKLDTLDNIDLTTIDFSTLNKNLSASDILKVIAFQIGQSLLLHRDIEVYTKGEVAKFYTEFTPFIYRYDKPNVDVTILDHALHFLIQYIRQDYPARMVGENNDIVWFIGENKKFNLITEKEVDYTYGPEYYKVLKVYLSSSFNELFELSKCNDVLLACYDDRYNTGRYIDDTIRFSAYIPRTIWESKYIEKYGNLIDDLYDFNDDELPRLIKNSKKCKELIYQLSLVREDYLTIFKDYFNEN